jgi:hypothetical protein
MGKLSIAGNRFSALTVGNFVINRTVLERVNLSFAELTNWRFLVQLSSKFKIEEPRFNYCTANDTSVRNLVQRVLVCTAPPVALVVAVCMSVSVSQVNKNNSLICSADRCTLIGCWFIKAEACMSNAVTENFVSQLPSLVRGLTT